MDEVEALTELKSRISADDWRTICDYVFKERELADQMLALSRNDVLEEAALIADELGGVREKSLDNAEFSRQHVRAKTIAAAIRARKDQEHG